MDPGYRSPLVDLFLKGEAARDVRLLAARGLLPRPAHEQIALLVVLSDDPDPEIAAQANATIARLPRGGADRFSGHRRPRRTARVLCGARSAEPAAAECGAAGCRGRPPATRRRAQRTRRTPRGRRSGRSAARIGVVADCRAAEAREKGTREQRAQLIRDSNRIVATAVLTSPKLTESEVEAFAKMGNVSEDVLRIIGTNRAWLKNYGIVLAVTRNPKTPPGISMQLMHRLTEKDIKMLTTDRNVPEALRLAARRILTKSKHG